MSKEIYKTSLGVGEHKAGNFADVEYHVDIGTFVFSKESMRTIMVDAKAFMVLAAELNSMEKALGKLVDEEITELETPDVEIDFLPSGWSGITVRLRSECFRGIEIDAWANFFRIVFVEEEKVVFIDIDEVFTPGARFTGVSEINPYTVNIFNAFFEHCPDWKIVISSVWKSQMPTSLMASTLLRCMGFKAYCKLHFNHRTPGAGFRGDNVRNWLKANPEVKDYIIIDDGCDFYREQIPHFLHIDPINGFGVRDLARMLEMANADKKYPDDYSVTFSPMGKYGNTLPRRIRFLLERVIEFDEDTTYAKGAIFKIDGICYIAVAQIDHCDSVCLAGPDKNARMVPHEELELLFTSE